MEVPRHNLLPLALLASCCAIAQSAEPEYPFPEKLIRDGDTSVYVQRAREFLEQAPEHPLSPRVAYELMMVAAVESDATLHQRMKEKLVLDYVQTLHGRFVVKSIAKEEDYRKLLTDAARSNRQKLYGEFAEEFTRAMKVGLRHYGEKLVSDSKFALLAALMAYDAGDERQGKALAAGALAKPELAEGLRQIAQAAFDQNASPSEKLVALHAIKDSKTGRLFEDYFMALMPEEALARPEVRNVFVENHLRNKDYREALALLDEADDEAESSRELFRRAWCCACLGDRDTALVCLDRLGDSDEDPWVSAGRELGRRIENIDQNLSVYADAVLSAVQELKKGVAAFEASATLGVKKSGKKMGIYLGILPDRNVVEFHLLANGTHALAYRTTPTGSRVYVEGEPAILCFEKPGPVPIPQLSLTEEKDKELTFHAGMQFGASVASVAAANRSFLDSPALNTKEGILRPLQRRVQKGAFPSDVAPADGGRRFVWLSPVADEPTFTTVEYVISSDHKIAAVRYKKTACSIRYSSEDSFRLSPPAWPELRTVTKQEFDPSLLFKMMGMLVEKFKSAE